MNLCHVQLRHNTFGLNPAEGGSNQEAHHCQEHEAQDSHHVTCGNKKRLQVEGRVSLANPTPEKSQVVSNADLCGKMRLQLSQNRANAEPP